METKEENHNNIKRLYRSTKEKKIFGICAGLADYFDIDPTFVRILWLFFTFFGGGIFFLIYIILYFIIPTVEMNKKPIKFDFESLKKRRIKRSINQRLIAGICGGISKYFHIDPVLVRLTAVVIDALTGFIPIIILYLLLIWIIPLDTDELSNPSRNI